MLDGLDENPLIIFKEFFPGKQNGKDPAENGVVESGQNLYYLLR